MGNNLPETTLCETIFPIMHAHVVAFVASTALIVKVSCECIMGNNLPETTLCETIFPVMHTHKQYFNWFIIIAFLASTALNDSKWQAQ